MSNSKLYVGNLSFHVTGDQLAQLFLPFSNEATASIVTDRDSGQSRGFAFVEMGTAAAADAAVNALNGQLVEGRTITVSIARPRETNTARGGRSPSRGPRHGGRF